MFSGKLIEEIALGDLVILKSRRKNDKKNIAIIMKILEPYEQYCLESFSWTKFRYLVYIGGETRYVTEGHVERILSSTENIGEVND